MSPLAPIAIRTMPPSRPVAAPSSASGMQSLKRRAETAILTTSAPAARMVRARSARSAGTASKSCDDRTIRRPPVWRRRSSNPARHSTSTNSAPRSSASPSIRRRSSSDPSKRPPSHAGRQVTMTGTRRPASAPATSGSLTPSSLSSTRSASRTASRRWRSSAVDVAVTVTHRRGFGISFAGLKARTTRLRPKKKPLQGYLKRLGISRVVNVQARAIASSVVRQYHRHAVEEALFGWGVNANVLNRFTRLPTETRTIAEGRAAVNSRAHFSLTSKHFSSITEWTPCRHAEPLSFWFWAC